MKFVRPRKEHRDDGNASGSRRDSVGTAFSERFTFPNRPQGGLAMNQKLINELMAIYRQAERDGMVKVAIPGGTVVEFRWAKRLSNHFSRLANCCVCGADVNYGDVVEFRELPEPHPNHKDFVRVVSKGSWQCVVSYATPEERERLDSAAKARLRRRWRAITKYFQSLSDDEQPLVWEGLEMGVLCVAVPLSLTEAEVDGLLGACPHLVLQ
jgi:hypothetical protein